MTRYFFDLDNQSWSVYDHEGRHCETPDVAYQMAETIKGLQGIEWAILRGHSVGNACGWGLS